MRFKHITPGILLLALLTSLVFSSTFSGTIQNEDKVGLSNTNLEIIQGGEVIVDGLTVTQGRYSFELADGYYILRASRFGYAQRVFGIEVDGETQRNFIMPRNSHISDIYGQVLSNGVPLEGASVLVKVDGLVFERGTSHDGGMYVLKHVPEGTATVSASMEGYRTNEISAIELKNGRPAHLDIQLSRTGENGNGEPAPSQYSIQVPEKVDLGETLTIQLSSNLGPIANELISVQTPSGTFNIATDGQGEAKLNAAEEGTYIFTYMNISEATVVEEEAPPIPEDHENETTPGTGNGETQPPPAEQDSPLLLIVILVSVVLLILIIGTAILFLTKGKKQEKPEGGKK